MADKTLSYTVAKGRSVSFDSEPGVPGKEVKEGKKVELPPAQAAWMVEDGALVPDDEEAHSKAVSPPTRKRN